MQNLLNHTPDECIAPGTDCRSAKSFHRPFGLLQLSESLASPQSGKIEVFWSHQASLEFRNEVVHRWLYSFRNCIKAVKLLKLGVLAESWLICKIYDLVACKQEVGNGAGNVMLARQIKEREPSSTVSYGGVTAVCGWGAEGFFLLENWEFWLSTETVVMCFTKSPGACEVRHQRALQIGRTWLNDFYRCRNRNKPFMDQRRIWNSKYFAKSLRLQTFEVSEVSPYLSVPQMWVERIIMDFCLQLSYFIDSRKWGHCVHCFWGI